MPRPVGCMPPAMTSSPETLAKPSKKGEARAAVRTTCYVRAWPWHRHRHPHLSPFLSPHLMLCWGLETLRLGPRMHGAENGPPLSIVTAPGRHRETASSRVARSHANRAGFDPTC